MYFHGDSISIAGFPQATLFCMRRSLGEMELHRIWEAFASAAIASNLHLKERKDMHAMHAHLDLEKSISSWLVPLPFWLCNCFSVPHFQSNIIHILSVFPSPLCFVFLSFQLTPCFPLALSVLSPFRIRASGGGYVSDKTTLSPPTAIRG